jgi:hypothetical protein
MSSIKYDNTELVGATYIPRYVKHETAPERLLNAVKLARQDGQVIIDDNFSVKYIDIAGVITGADQATMEANIDTLKELLSRKDKNLDIVYGGGTRRYVCRSLTFDINRDFYHLLHAPYVVRFFVAKGYGTDTSETTAINEAGIVTAETTKLYTFAGSYQPKPRHKISLNTRGNLDVIRITNNLTGDYIDIDWGNVSGQPSWIEANEENQTVLNDSGVAVNYRGKFPSVALGAEQSLKLTVIGSRITAPNQQQNTNDDGKVVFYDDGVYAIRQAQSFVPDQSGRVQKIELRLRKTGSPTGNVDVQIYTDNNGKPGSAVNTGTFRIAVADVGAQNYYYLTLVSGVSPFLIAGQRYWIFLNGLTITGTDVSNYITWYYQTDATHYLYGKAMYWESFDQIWTDGVGGHPSVDGQFDMQFRIYLGDSGAPTHDITWQVYYTKKYL